MFNCSINKRSRGVITPVKALFRLVEAFVRLSCFEGGNAFGADLRSTLRGWLGVTPNHLWIEDDDEICIVFHLKDEHSSHWEEHRMFVNREGELSSTSLSDEMLSKLQQGLAELFK